MTPDTGISGPSKNDEPEGGLPSFAVIVPMFNEAAGAERCVREISRVLRALANRTELIVVNDGSTDGTGPILEGLARTTSGLDVVTHVCNRGYGAALTTGAARADARGFEFALFMDSDMTNSPEDVPRLAARLAEDVDVLKATRYSLGGSVHGVPFYRVAISTIGNRFARFLFRVPIHDCTNGFRAVRCRLLRQMRLTERGFPIIMEELYWCRFLTGKFDEIAVVLRNRSGEQRPTSFAYRPSVFWRYAKYPLRAFFGIRPRGLPSGERS